MIAVLYSTTGGSSVDALLHCLQAYVQQQPRRILLAENVIAE